MSTISVRLPRYYHEQLRRLAKKEGVSINQLIALAIGEKISALAAEEYLQQRAQSGDHQKYLAALAKVSADNEPRRDDQLD